MNFRLLIADTNVLIDLCDSGALSAFLDLNYEVCTTDLVLAEIRKPDQLLVVESEVHAGKLRVLELTNQELYDAMQLPTQVNLKRITDKSILLKAIQLKCVLITCDKDLRSEAIRRTLEVHGSIWAFDQIREEGAVAPSSLLDMVEKLEKCNPRLPAKELDELKGRITW